MIVVSVQYTDKPDEAVARNNGGFGIHFYNLSEAKLFAQSESTQLKCCFTSNRRNMPSL